jgi:cysteine synthase A
VNIASDIIALIGKTPLVRINRIFGQLDCTVAAKLEQLNPAASVKDRTALGMIVAAEQSGALGAGGTLVEATSGNTGIAMAYIGVVRGYKVIVVMPESMSVERQRLLSAFGAKVVLTPSHLGMQESIDEAQRLAATIPGAVVVGQFKNPANPTIHEQTTAEEILADTDGKVDVFIAGIGTGGTITGVGRRLKRHNAAIRIIGVEPAASSVLSGGRCGPHMIQGIGAGFVPDILDRTLIDEVIGVGDVEAYEWTRKIIQQEGIFAGISSGAAACATARYLRHRRKGDKVIVTLFPDTGERYLSVPMLLKDC